MRRCRRCSSSSSRSSVGVVAVVSEGRAHASGGDHVGDARGVAALGGQAVQVPVRHVSPQQPCLGVAGRAPLVTRHHHHHAHLKRDTGIQGGGKGRVERCVR